MRLKFLYIFFTIAFGASAQTELAISKLKNYYSRFQPEHIQGHLNKTSLAQGEHLLFKLWINSTSSVVHNLSAIVYVEILDDAKRVLARQKLHVINGAADGAIKIPEHLPGGHYYFKAYTLWMNNVGEWSFFSQSLVIGNEHPTVSATLGFIDSRKQRIRVTRSANGLVEIQLDTTMNGFIVAHRMGKILYSNDVLTTERKIHAFSDTPAAGSIEVGLFHPSGKLLEEVSLPNIETEALVITTAKKTFKPRERIDLSIMVGGDVEAERDFSISVRKKSSLVAKNFIHNFSGSVPWSAVLRDVQPISSNREISILPIGAESLHPIQFSSVGADGAKRLTDNLNPERIKTIYGLPTEVQELRFARLPADNTYLPEQYLDLPSLEDFFQEVVPEARVKKNVDKKAIFLRNIENPNRVFFYGKSPLLLVNNKIVTDQERFLAMSPATIQRIDLCWRTETINDTGIQTLANTGVISVFTKVIDELAEQDIYKDFARPVVFVEANHAQASASENLPDFRSTLFWRSSVKITSSAKISFYLSDELGDYTIDVAGSTDEGSAIRQSYDFAVGTEQ